jgi:hypothetical protein
VSDPFHTAIVKFDRVAVQRFEKVRREAKRQQWTLTSSVGGIFNLRKMQTRFETPPETVCKRADMLRGRTLVLYVPDFAYLGSEGEPRFWHNTQPLWSAKQLSSIRRAFNARIAQQLNRQVLVNATAADLSLVASPQQHKQPQQPQQQQQQQHAQQPLHQPSPNPSPRKALQAQNTPSGPPKAQKLIPSEEEEVQFVKERQAPPVKETPRAPTNPTRTRHTNALEVSHPASFAELFRN